MSNGELCNCVSCGWRGEVDELEDDGQGEGGSECPNCGEQIDEDETE